MRELELMNHETLEDLDEVDALPARAGVLREIGISRLSNLIWGESGLDILDEVPARNTVDQVKRGGIGPQEA